MASEEPDKPQIACPACGQLNDPLHRFCGMCGAELSKTPPEYPEPAKKSDYLLSPCPSCGNPNPPGDATCGSCGAKLPRPPEPPPTPPMLRRRYSRLPARPMLRERPGCVTAYAILLGIGGVLTVVGAIAVGAQGNVGYCIGGILYAAFCLGIVNGLWNLNGWARIAVIVLESLSAIGSLISLASGQPFAILGLVLGGVVIWWFALNGDYFD